MINTSKNKLMEPKTGFVFAHNEYAPVEYQNNIDTTPESSNSSNQMINEMNNESSNTENSQNTENTENTENSQNTESAK